MSQREPDLLPEWQAPAGGLARLQARRAEMTDAGILASLLKMTDWRAYVPLLAGATAAVLLLVFVPTSLAPTSEADRLLGMQATGQSLHLLDAQSVAQQLPSRQPGVRLYWTESLSGPASASVEAKP